VSHQINRAGGAVHRRLVSRVVADVVVVNDKIVLELGELIGVF